MSSPILVDLFVEDLAHEELLKPLLARLGSEAGVAVRTRVRSARGGHPRALKEFRLYQSVQALPLARSPADLVVVAIDANCSPFPKARQRIRDAAESGIRERLITACPDPHVERWYLADLESFKTVVGPGPTTVEPKCVRSHYKGILESAVRQAGHPHLDGTDFAPELARGMDLYRAGRNDSSLKAFFDELRAAFRQHSRAARPRAARGGES